MYIDIYSNIGSTGLSVDIRGCSVARRKAQPLTSILGLNSLGLTLLDPDYQTCPNWHMSHLIHVYLFFDFLQMGQNKYALEHVLKLKTNQIFQLNKVFRAHIRNHNFDSPSNPHEAWCLDWLLLFQNYHIIFRATLHMSSLENQPMGDNITWRN